MQEAELKKQLGDERFNQTMELVDRLGVAAVDQQTGQRLYGSPHVLNEIAKMLPPANGQPPKRDFKKIMASLNKVQSKGNPAGGGGGGTPMDSLETLGKKLATLPTDSAEYKRIAEKMNELAAKALGG